MKIAQKAVVWGLEKACAVLDNIPRWTKDGFYWRGQWGCGALGGRLALLSAQLDEQWHTGVWK